MMFASLFFAYAVLRARATAWPPPTVDPLPVFLPGIATLVIGLSSLTLEIGLGRARQKRRPGLLPFLCASIALGALFVAVQIHVWTSLWQDGLRPSSGTYGSVFYLLTVFHFLHVLVGLGLLGGLVPHALRGDTTPARRVPAKLIGMFWHFVAGVWVAIYLSLYVL
jgi:cytochrome c oxidase subunit 3